MSKFKVIEHRGKFFLKSDTEQYPDSGMASREAAQLACDQLNYEPSPRACETAYNAGRWTKREEQAA